MAEMRSSLRPLVDSGTGPQHPFNRGQLKCSSKKNSSISSAMSGLFIMSRAIGTSTSGVSISSLNATKSSRVAKSFMIRRGLLLEEMFEEMGML